jgi:hypothetical protein
VARHGKGDMSSVHASSIEDSKVPAAISAAAAVNNNSSGEVGREDESGGGTGTADHPSSQASISSSPSMELQSAASISSRLPFECSHYLVFSISILYIELFQFFT